MELEAEELEGGGGSRDRDREDRMEGCDVMTAEEQRYEESYDGSSVCI
jgi:hypothetical protein